MSDDTPTRGSAAPPSPREVLRLLRLRVLRSDRPYWLALGGATVFAVVVVSGPVQTWLEQRDLVDRAEATLGVLEDENARLEQRVEELNDPATIEAEAREQQGMARPGEVPYEVVPPPVDDEQIAPDLSEVEPEQRSWLARAWEALTEFFG